MHNLHLDFDRSLPLLTFSDMGTTLLFLFTVGERRTFRTTCDDIFTFHLNIKQYILILTNIGKITLKVQTE